jgi:hypothetical protein
MGYQLKLLGELFILSSSDVELSAEKSDENEVKNINKNKKTFIDSISSVMLMVRRFPFR